MIFHYVVYRNPHGEDNKGRGNYWNQMLGWVHNREIASEMTPEDTFRIVGLLSRRGFNVKWMVINEKV